ncbi:MAG: TlpA disulfide reductase family protein [Kofleriaceae bacterium]
MPLQRHLRLAAIVLGLGSLGACHRGPKVPAGDIAASLTVPSLAGDLLDVQSLEGKPTLLLFVTPSCVHCLATIPNAIAAAHDKNANVAAVFVAGTRDRAQRVIDQLKFPGPALFDDGTLRARYHVNSVPYILVLGPDGHAKAAFEGEQSMATLFDAL